MSNLRLLNVVGARPNVIKIARLMAAYRAFPEIKPLLVPIGQRYDEKMGDLSLRELRLPEPQINIGVGGESHATQCVAIAAAF